MIKYLSKKTQKYSPQHGCYRVTKTKGGNLNTGRSIEVYCIYSGTCSSLYKDDR